MRITDAKTAKLVSERAEKDFLEKQYKEGCLALTPNEQKEYELFVGYIEEQIGARAEARHTDWEAEEKLFEQVKKFRKLLTYLFNSRGFKIRFDYWNKEGLLIEWW